MFINCYSKSITFYCVILFVSSQSLFAKEHFGKSVGIGDSNKNYNLNFNKKDSCKTLSPFLKSLIEIGTIYSVRTSIYLQTGALQDNDYTSWSSGFSERFKSKDPYRLDDNSLFINHVGHAFLPAVETGLFRSNGMNFYHSFLLQFSASSIWEFVIEARETVSLNDMIMTPVAGASISEVSYQFSQFFRKSKKTTHNNFVGGLFTGIMAFNYWMNNDKRMVSSNLDKNGFDANVYHKFKASSGIGQPNSGEASTGELGMEMEIININNYGLPGEERHHYKQPFTANFNLNLISSLKEFGELNLELHTMFNGFYSKNIRMDSSLNIKGNSLLYGAVTGYEINYSQFPTYNDNLIHLHVLGAEVQWISYFNDIMIKSKTIAYGDMSTVTSQLLNDYSIKIGGLDSAKNTLKKESYYNALGVSASSELEIKKGRFSVGGKVTFGKYSSIEKLDRHQESVAYDFHLDDIRIKKKFWGSYFLNPALEIQMGYEYRSFNSKIEELNHNFMREWLYGKLVILY